MNALEHRDDPAPVTIGSFDAWPELHGAWYDDPFGQADLRWWDGSRWCADVKASDEPGRSGFARPVGPRFSARLLAALSRA